MNSALTKSAAWVGSICRYIAAIGLIALMLVASLTVVDAVMRRFFASSINGLSDIVEWCIVVAVSACIPAMLWSKSAITVRVLGTLLPWRAREVLEFIGDSLLLATIMIICWQLSIYAYEVYRYDEVSLLLLWPKWPVWGAAVLIWYFAAFVQLMMSFQQLARVFAREKPPELTTQEVI